MIAPPTEPRLPPRGIEVDGLGYADFGLVLLVVAVIFLLGSC